ncbi:alpha-L-rhamnosidase [Kineosporia sp. NBRC 101677]|uniref:alpha-L-rhamnosidase n=1 Tax=Kineosporia sp. NBRC 101677 TaxID=3032197 RepID=UPI0024A3EC99|nr:alpha-L-rhamnosidase [Kineosporia sp. NBRC 101677]GLY18930.1 alpha-L-rhamnosidase [Kineosporia sp. NBRC 101677]
MRTTAEGELWLEDRRGTATLGIGEATPRLSWIVPAQAAPIVHLCALYDDGRRVWATGSGPAGSVAWPFAPLTSRERVRVSVHAAVEDPALVQAEVEAGLLIEDDWTADFVSPSPSASSEKLRPAYLMRARWHAPVDLGAISRARLYVTSHGVHELELNGERVGNSVLDPGWTSYRHRLRYRTHDVTAAVRAGENVIGAWLADGWYRGRIGFDGGLWDLYGEDVSLLAQLEIHTDDGRRHVAELSGWKWAFSPITAVGLYEGETYDARLEQSDWSRPGFDDSGWEDVSTVVDVGVVPLEAPTAGPVTTIETLKPVSVQRRPNGRVRLDFGQNISGRLRLRMDGGGHRAGQVVRLHHAEVLEGEELAVRPLRTAVSIDEYVCSGESERWWSPRFTLHGFRYAEIEGWTGELATEDVLAEVVHTEMQRTGWFSSSNPALNRLHENVVWSMRDNFVDLPTDCPQRDERVGWTGDIQVFAPTALFLHACHGTLDGWLRDLWAEQRLAGHVPLFVPWVPCGFPDFPTAVWGDAAVLVPWAIHQHSGDTSVLARQYDSMCAWVDLVEKATGGTGLWDRGHQLGDWLDPAAPPDEPGNGRTDKHLVATAYHVRSSRVLSEVAAVLGRDEDARRYREVAARAANSFQRHYVTPDGRLVSDTPTALSLALVFDLLDGPAQRLVAGRRLSELVRAGGYRISTGFVGTPIVCDALVQAGDVDGAYHLLLNDECPSWLYAVSMGATTIWERWDSLLPDGSVNPGGMTSFNHYALGAVADFMHRVVAGLDKTGPGYQRLRFAPRPGGGLTHAGARHDAPTGTVASSWVREGATLTVTVEVPPGASGLVVLPGETGAEHEVGAGTHTFQVSYRPAEEDPARPERTTRMA